jgi:hypothetical protein
MIKNMANPNIISVSFQTMSMPDPFNIIFFTIIINHFAGMIFDIHCKIHGIFSIGNINPESIIVGSNNPMTEIIKATSCVFAMVEIKMPKDKVVSTNNNNSNSSNKRFPLIGTPNTKYPRSSTIIEIIKAKNI